MHHCSLKSCDKPSMTKTARTSTQVSPPALMVLLGLLLGVSSPFS